MNIGAPVVGRHGALLANRWDASHDLLPAVDLHPSVRPFCADDLPQLSDELSYWDIWPVQLDDGALADVAGGSLWVMLSAPRTNDPEDRHNLARMHLVQRVDGLWRDCGPLLPDGFTPGSREWSGSTRLDLETGHVTLWFTATGRRGEQLADFEQRLFHVSGTLDLSGDRPAIHQWRDLTQSVLNDGTYYADLAVNQGKPGMIKGFRDPYWFRDPLDGKGYLLFTGSKPADQSQSAFDGVIGIAAASDPDGLCSYQLLPALIDGDGQANELERPHIFVQDGLYYLFWSSQRHVFAPGGLEGPTGLYGMVAPGLFGPWEPLNGSGLVLTNPISEPRQSYAWQVIPDSLDVISFVDYWGLDGRDIDADPALKTRHFGGTIAPMARILLSGRQSRIVSGGV